MITMATPIKKQLAIKDELTGEIQEVYPETSADCVYIDDKTTILDKMNELNEKIDKMKDDMAGMSFESLSISSFSINPTYVEKGDIINSITFNYSFNKTPKQVKIQIGSDIYDVNNNSTTITDLSIKSTISCELIAYDTNNSIVSKTISLPLYRRYFYGAADNFTELTDLNQVVRNSKSMELSIDAGNDKYIYFCCPLENINDTTNFNVGGFDGGFEFVGITNLQTICEGSSFYISNDGSIDDLREDNIINDSADSNTKLCNLLFRRTRIRTY